MIVVLDIETVQASRSEWARLVGLPELAPEGGSAEPADDLFTRADVDAQRRREDEAYEKSAFDGSFSRIVCIGMLQFSNEMEPRGAVCWYGSNERE
ncbi:MAG: hypothetical protein V3S25_10500, partial [Nitrospirales bacterium]